MRGPKVIGIGGFASNVGKTKLMCSLISAFPSWEAIKTTRGHYRSCGKDPHSCCVSHLLTDEPVLFSGRDQTYAPGKDTGRYWDAGASNVHWMIATNEQVEKGIKSALERVRTSGVFIEGNSFTEYIEPDAFIMVVPADGTKSKSSARRALKKVSAIYLSSEDGVYGEESFNHLKKGSAFVSLPRDVPVYTEATLSNLIADLNKIYSATLHTRTHENDLAPQILSSSS